MYLTQLWSLGIRNTHRQVLVEDPSETMLQKVLCLCIININQKPKANIT